MKLIAVLDEKKHLVGTDQVDEPSPEDIVLPSNFDLPTDGSYKWEDGAFWPLGHNFPRAASRPPVSDVSALHAMIRWAGDDAPLKARQWADWFEENIKQREEERQVAFTKKSRR